MFNSKKRKLERLTNSKFSALDGKTRMKKKLNEAGDEKITRIREDDNYSSEEEDQEEDAMNQEGAEQKMSDEKPQKDEFTAPKRKEKRKIGVEEEKMESEDSDLEFEDEFDDEYDEEDQAIKEAQEALGEGEGEADDDFEDIEDDEEGEGNEDEEWESDNGEENKEVASAVKNTSKDPNKPKKKVQIMEERKKEEKVKEKVVPFLDSAKKLKEGEYLDFDNSAYEMMHRANTDWPCLSFDILLEDYENYFIHNDNFKKMNKYPYTVHLVSGTQSEDANKNFLYLMKMTKLHKTKHDDDSDDNESEEDDDVDNDEDPELIIRRYPIKGAINRIRSMLHRPIVGVWNETGTVEIYDMREEFELLKTQEKTELIPSKKNQMDKKLLKTFKHSNEGFAIDWSPLKLGRLATGSVDRKIFIYEPLNNATDWKREDNPYTFHEDSVEDIQFSPVEEFVFASCSVDRTIKICDMRVGKKNQAQISILAHESDVNVISWNYLKPNLLASGCDDGSFKIWDLQAPKTAIAEILWHTEPITSVHFQPNEESVLAVSSGDDRLGIWDFAVEADDQDKSNEEMEEEVPDQLMFLHQGQEDIKEIRYHPLYFEMLISTAKNGFHLFKPSLDKEDDLKNQEEEEEDPKKIPVIHEKDLEKYLAKLSLN